MSSIHSTPPTAGQRSHPVGFNDQTYYDPFFPSSPSEEHLIPVESSRSPSHRSYHTPSPPHISTAGNGGLQNPAASPQYYDHLQPPSHTNAISGHYSTFAPQSDVDRDPANSPYDFLSPNTYMSDNGYNASSEHATTPEGGGDGFYLEDNFGMLENLDQATDINNPASVPIDHLQPSSADIDSPHNSNYTRTSAGAATLSSHLMSPVLTDLGGLPSRRGSESPPMDQGYTKDENIHTVPAAILMHNVNEGNYEANHTIGPGQQITPTLTESSKGTSPELTPAISNIAHASSPVVRVELHSRGDSPTRGNPILGGGTKRNWIDAQSSHLIPQQDEGAEEDGKPETDYFSAALASSQRVGRTGLDPEERVQVSDMGIPNFKDQEEAVQRTIKNMDVAEWLDRSDPGSQQDADVPPRKPVAKSKRQRARSAGAQVLSHANLESLKSTVIDANIPGPGILINEESGDEDEDDEDEGTLASIDDSPPPTTALGEPVNETPGEAKPGVYDELPNQPALYRAKLWQDPLYDSSDPGVKMQPETANAAIMRFSERAGDIETLSRVATWGTRRLSESDLESLFHRFRLNDKKAGEDKSKRDRRGTFLQQAAAKLVPKMKESMMKRQESESSKQQHSRNDSQASRKDSPSVLQPPPTGLRRMSSLGKRPKSPRINTGSAIAAMAFQTGALGAGGPHSATATSSPTSWPTNVMKRSRSRSDLNGLGLPGPNSSSATELGLAELWTKQGGPPMPTLAAPIKTEELSTKFGDGEEDEEDDGVDDHGVTMDLSIRADTIIPTLEGFKSNIRQLNPRLPPFMFDRIAQEQLRRFKKLMDFKIKHAQALNARNCSSGKYCTELGGEPTYLPSRSSGREPDYSATGFSIAGLGQSDEDVNALAEGIVTPAQFPPGVPMPPVKRLPAEFECSLCFKVKKFQKPSDWSKHVHEDVQPFTCTFVNCAEPKSFKRKADWVRHENERHRQLEWWMCNMNDCNHKCYRKDNFVQHLVREHKLPEPKIKTNKSGKPAVRGPSSQKARGKHAEDSEESHDEVDQVWKLVEECRHETAKSPKSEACKFCGNICNSWKKLTVHLAKHMEQISMPVLTVVKQKEVTAETIISPIEQRITAQQPSMSPTAQSPFSQSGQSSSLSPFGMSLGTGTPLPGAFTSLQPKGYFATAEQQAMNYQRVSPNTYPPPRHGQMLTTSYSQTRDSPYPLSNTSSFGGSPAPPATPQFNPVNSNRGFAHPQSSSPENLYGGLSAPTSQPRALPYDNREGFQYAPQQQQTTFTNPVENNTHPFAGAMPTRYGQQTPPSTSYPPQQQQMSPPNPSYPQQTQMSPPLSGYHQQPVPMSGQESLQYNQLAPAQDYQQEISDPSAYSQRRQQQPPNQGPYIYGRY